MIKLIKGDCLEKMREIESGSIDAIICDPPYGTTACKWDSVIPFDKMWEQLNRIIKPNGAIVLFGSEPFSSALRMSNIKNYKYDWVWEKSIGGNFASVKYAPSKKHENIIIFNKHNFYPIREKSKIKKKSSNKGNKTRNNNVSTITPKKGVYKDDGLRHPSSVQFYCNQSGELNNTKRLHPTQKPVALMEYLIKTYTNEGETVLDFTMGSGTTGVACKNLNRSFIGIEQDDKYFEIAKGRIENIAPSLFGN